MNKSLSLQEFIDLDELQAIQDSFAETTGISSVFLSPEGKPLTRLTNPTGFCSLIHSTEEGKRRCVRSFVEMNKKAADILLLRPWRTFCCTYYHQW
jgi:ligand-binding sensor protein